MIDNHETSQIPSPVLPIEFCKNLILFWEYGRIADIIL